MDVEFIIDPLRQIVPSLLDIPYSAGDLLPRPATDDDELITTLQQDAFKCATTMEPTGEEILPADTSSADEQRDTIVTNSLTVESVAELPTESTVDTISNPDVTFECHTGTDVVVGDTLDIEET